MLVAINKFWLFLMGRVDRTLFTSLMRAVRGKYVPTYVLGFLVLKMFGGFCQIPIGCKALVII